MAPLSSLKKVRESDNVLLTKSTKNEAFFEKKAILLPKPFTSLTSSARLVGNFKTSTNAAVPYLPELDRHGKNVSTVRFPVLLSPVFGNKTRWGSPLFSRKGSPCDSDFYGSDFDDSSFSETTEASEIDSKLLEILNKEVSKRVIAGMVLTTKCGQKAQDISEKNLGTRVEKFLGRSIPIRAASPKFPRLLTPLASPRPQRPAGDTWSLKEQKISKVFSESLRAVYSKSGEGKCRYIRAPLTPIPSIDWVFESCGKVEMLSPTKR